MMSDNDIRKGFQSKFSGFEAPVPADGWEGVERSLKAVAAARVALRRKWYAGAAAAVMVLLIGSILFMRNPAEQAGTGTVVSESVSSAPVTSTISATKKELVKEPELSPEPVARQSENRQLLAAKKKETVKSNKKQVVRHANAGGILAAWMERKQLQVKGTEERIDPDALQLLTKADENRYDRSLTAEETIVIGGDNSPFFAGGMANERGEGTLLLAVNGRGGLSGYQQTVNSPMTLRSATVAAEDKYPVETNKMQLKIDSAPGNVSEMEHDQPVSFGITVSKYLLDDLSVETGLIYSYLHSKTRNTNNSFYVEEVQRLHYLGIPVNVNYNLFSLQKLNVYVSVGGMVEKDVYGEYQRMKEAQITQYNSLSEGSEENEISKISQRNPQLSVNAGVGVSFPLYDRLRLYGKIGGAYYFDAENQYKTIYSDRKIVMDLNVGLRYEF